jgi:hypothetical protein
VLTDPVAVAEALSLIAHDGRTHAALAIEMAEWLDRRLAQAPRRARRSIAAPGTVDADAVCDEPPPSARVLVKVLEGLAQSCAVLGVV